MTASAGQQPKRGRLPYLDGLRAMAALWVLASHSFDMLGLNAASSVPGLLQGIVQATSYARIAVAAFIVISGFSLMLPLAVQPPGLTWRTFLPFSRRFYARRASRILPPYYAALALSVALGIALRLESAHALVADGLSHVLLLHDISYAFYHWNQYAAFNPPLWSIAVEWHIYALFPLLVMFWQRYGILRTAGMAILASWIVVEVVALRATRSLDFPFYVGGMTFPYYGFFAAGVMAAVTAFGPSAEAVRLRRLPWGGMAAGCFLMSLTALVLLPKYLYTQNSEVFAIPFALGVASLLIFLASCRDSVAERILSARPLATLGGFSYSLYLIHYPLCLLLGRLLGHLHLLGTNLGFWVVLLGFCPVTILVAYAFSRGFERRWSLPAPLRSRTSP